MVLHFSRYAKGAVTSRALVSNSNELRKYPFKGHGPEGVALSVFKPQERQEGLSQFVNNMPRIAQVDTAPQYPSGSVDIGNRLTYRGFNVIESENGAVCSSAVQFVEMSLLVPAGGLTCLA